MHSRQARERALLFCLSSGGGGLVAKSCPTLATPWTVACQALLSMRFSRQEYWSGLPCLSPGALLDPGIETISLVSRIGRLVLYQQHHLGSSAAKSLQSCPTLYNPIDGSPPGSPIPGILQARTLEWVAISFSNA